VEKNNVKRKIPEEIIKEKIDNVWKNKE